MKWPLPIILLCFTFYLNATDYHVGPSQSLSTIAEVPWATLQAGDRVFIHWQTTPYREKWVINRQGTADNPIEIIGVSNAQGQQPIISGENATTPTNLNYWNEMRGIIKIGGSVLVFPNPTADIIQVNWGDKTIAKIELIDMYGQVLLETSATSIAMGHFSKGGIGLESS